MPTKPRETQTPVRTPSSRPSAKTHAQPQQTGKPAPTPAIVKDRKPATPSKVDPMVILTQYMETTVSDYMTTIAESMQGLIDTLSALSDNPKTFLEAFAVEHAKASVETPAQEEDIEVEEVDEEEEESETEDEYEEDEYEEDVETETEDEYETEDDETNWDDEEPTPAPKAPSRPRAANRR